MTNGWKITAIIFIALFLLETLSLVFLWNLTSKEIENQNICLYDICSDYPDGYYDLDICYCYDYSLLGELEVVKTEYMP